MITSCIHYKGGVGKTTTCCNLAGAAYSEGLRALIVDLDPQGSASLYFDAASGPTVFDWMIGREPLAAVIRWVRPVLQTDDDVEQEGAVHRGAIGVVPSDERLAGLQAALRDWSRLDFLVELLGTEEVRSTLSGFDHVLVDCPPGADYLAENALRASDVVLSTMALTYMSVTGLLRVAANVRLAREQGYASRWLVVPTMFRQRRVQTRTVYENLKEQLGTFPEGSLLAPVHESVDLSYAFDARKTVFEYAPEGQGARCYRSVFEQLESVRLGLHASRRAASSSQTPVFGA